MWLIKCICEWMVKMYLCIVYNNTDRTLCRNKYKNIETPKWMGWNKKNSEQLIRLNLFKHTFFSVYTVQCTLYIFNSIERLLIWKLLSTKWENKMKVFGFCFMFMHLSFVLCFVQRRKVHKFIHFIRLIVSNLFYVHRAIKKSSSYMHLCACVFPFSRYIN